MAAKTYKLSPSGLWLFSDCPRCFWLRYNTDVRRPRGIFPSLPSGMDKVLKNYFDSYREKGGVPPVIEKEEPGIELFSDLELLNEWRNNFRGVSWKDEGGDILFGAVDDMLKKDEKLIVLDYKTRGFPLKEDTAGHYEDQLNIYNFLLEKNGYKVEDYSYLLFYYPERAEKRGNVLFNTELVKVYTEPEKGGALFYEALDTLRGPIPDASSDCCYCEFIENMAGVKI